MRDQDRTCKSYSIQHVSGFTRMQIELVVKTALSLPRHRKRHHGNFGCYPSTLSLVQSKLNLHNLSKPKYSCWSGWKTAGTMVTFSPYDYETKHPDDYASPQNTRIMSWILGSATSLVHVDLTLIRGPSGNFYRKQRIRITG